MSYNLNTVTKKVPPCKYCGAEPIVVRSSGPQMTGTFTSVQLGCPTEGCLQYKNEDLPQHKYKYGYYVHAWVANNKMAKYFKDSEFTCKCGCGTNNIDDALVRKLDIAREKAGVPFVINSACRCAAHNKKVGGSATSSHLTGHAVDISATTGTAKFKIVQGLLEAGFTRIGVAKSFIHVDNDPNKPAEVIWLY